MVAIALVNEARPSPGPLHDPVLAVLPRIEWIAAHNYHLWLALYVPLALWLWAKDRRTFVRFLWVGGWLSLVRGVCILATGLGPVDGVDRNAGMTAAGMVAAWWGIVNPISALTTDVAHVSLTKDLFFSGHAATTFLLWLYARPWRRLAAAAMAAHVVVVASVFLAHLHYTIDVAGAWAITAVVWSVAERRSRRRQNSPA